MLHATQSPEAGEYVNKKGALQNYNTYASKAE
jgi:hypothetical protein